MIIDADTDKGDAEDTRRCLNVLEAMSDDSTAETSAAHAAFHFALYDAADSAWLLRLIRTVWETSERYCHLATTANDIADAMGGAPLYQLGAR